MAQITNINFHQTFRPEKQYIAAILELAGNMETLTVKDISSLTGIPNGESSGKVEPHIFYANYMGLIEYEKEDSMYILSRTALGDAIFIEDPGLQEKLTILLCHCMIQRSITGAPLWSRIFKIILPMYKAGIRKDMLLKELEVPFDGKVNTKNIAPFFGSYDTFFDSLCLLQEEGDLVKIQPMQYDKEFIYVYAYTLFSYWDECFSNQDEITSTQLEMLCFGKVLGWDTQEEYQVLEYLSDCGIIRMNRQLMPYTLLKLTGKDDLIEKLYSELC